MTSSLYIHVPFCAGGSHNSCGKCSYCDFYSIIARKGDPRLDAYLERLLADAGELFRKFKFEYIPTIYIGGGTPSILGPARMERLLSGLGNLLAALRKEHGASQEMEFTVEANPESLDEEFLRVCRNGGVNRISLGVQSFYEPSLRAVHRSGFQNSALTKEKLSLVSRSFPNGFSLDLISGLPLQNREVLLSDIRTAIAFEPSHVSLYSLTLEEGRALPGMLGRDEADSLWLVGRDSLIESGFPQYEVSNFAKQGKRSLHNVRYWRMENWLGLGPAASGTVIDEDTGTGHRYTIRADLDKWLASEAVTQEEFLDASVLMKESLLMGFRYAEGPDPVLFEKRFGIGIDNAIPKTLERWRENGCLAADKIALNRKGLVFLNSFLVEAFAELETRR